LNISPSATAAGPHQCHLSLNAEQLNRLEELRARASTTRGGAMTRVFLIRECLVRGLKAMLALSGERT
jgi:hypothetical protein